MALWVKRRAVLRHWDALIVMAAIMVSDELVEAGKRMRQLEEQLAGVHDAGSVTAERSKATQAAVAAAS